MYPVIALVGRPNSGKSSLFNRLIGRRIAITTDVSGTTRDRVLELIDFDSKKAILCDTAGLDLGVDLEDELEANIQKQTQLAIDEADLVLFVIDVSKPLTADDYAAAELLRTQNKQVILVANKCDRSVSENYVYDLYELGFGDPLKVSAIQKRGIEELYGLVKKAVRQFNVIEKDELDDAIRVAFLGRPNVGKSSLMNKVLKEDKVLVSNVSGTTRDAVSIPFEFEGESFHLVDTAGIRRAKKRNAEFIERLSVMRSLKALAIADIAVCVFDATEDPAKQDLRVCDFVLQAYKGVIIVVNKADLVKPQQKNRIMGLLRARLGFAKYAPLVFVSAKTGTNVEQILRLSSEIFKRRRQKFKTRDLNLLLAKLLLEHPLPADVKIKFISQVDQNPPTFLISCNDHSKVHFSYRRYIENQIRDAYDLVGTPVKFEFSSTKKSRS